MEDYNDCTIYQQAFLSLMSAEDIGYREEIKIMLKALCEANGVKFKK